jgi:hypothetical protein
VSRHHLGLSCVANAFTLSATMLRLCCEDEDEDDEEGEDDERAEGQGRGRMLGMKGVCTPCRTGWAITKCTLHSESEVRDLRDLHSESFEEGREE